MPESITHHLKTAVRAQKPLRRISDEALAVWRAMPVTAALDALGLIHKEDRSFEARKDRQTARLHVTLPSGRVVELISTGPRWYDKGKELGGCGAVDLAKHLLRLDFVTACKKLQSAPALPDAAPPRKII